MGVQTPSQPRCLEDLDLFQVTSHWHPERGCVTQHPPRFKKNEDLDSFSTAISDAWTKMPKIFSQMVISRWFTKVQSKKRHLKQARGYQTQTMQGFCKGNPTNSMRSPWWSRQITIYHQPRFPWNRGFPLLFATFWGPRPCEVAIIWPDRFRWRWTHGPLSSTPTVSVPPFSSQPGWDCEQKHVEIFYVLRFAWGGWKIENILQMVVWCWFTKVEFEKSPWTKELHHGPPSIQFEIQCQLDDSKSLRRKGGIVRVTIQYN